jgi:hypothetical protein
MEPTAKRSDDLTPQRIPGQGAEAAMEPTAKRSDDGSLFSGRLTWDDARLCERHGKVGPKSLIFVLSSSEKCWLTWVRATTGV